MSAGSVSLTSTDFRVGMREAANRLTPLRKRPNGRAHQLHGERRLKSRHRGAHELHGMREAASRLTHASETYTAERRVCLASQTRPKTNLVVSPAAPAACTRLQGHAGAREPDAWSPLGYMRGVTNREPLQTRATEKSWPSSWQRLHQPGVLVSQRPTFKSACARQPTG